VIPVIVVGEGQTEATFIRDVLGPSFTPVISLQPRLITTSNGARGGALSPDRVLRYLSKTVRERSDTYVTTLFDLYGLAPDFPGVVASRGRTDPLDRCRTIETALAEAVVARSGCRSGRFFAHIQPYEFEALLFSDVSQFQAVRSEWGRYESDLKKIRETGATPEHINSGPDTHPSARLERLLRPRYHKVLHGSAIARRIGLRKLRDECPHFSGWVERIERLTPFGPA
jgi:hypothetical protein